MSINRVNVTGNLTRDPELRITQGGTKILTFGVAVNDRRRNAQTGEWEDYPNFIDCVMFGAYAEAIQRHLAKGVKIGIEGRLSQRRWQKDGQNHSKIEVVVEKVELFSLRQESAQQPQTQPTYQAPPTYSAPPQQEVYDEDIPF